VLFETITIKANRIENTNSTNKQSSSQPLNWLSHPINQDEDDPSGFQLLLWDVKQRFVAIVTGKKRFGARNMR
jgi:hypothetical protein